MVSWRAWGEALIASPLLHRKHDDVADGALLAAGGHVDDLAPKIERRRAAAVQIERKFRALVEEELLQLRNARWWNRPRGGRPPR